MEKQKKRPMGQKIYLLDIVAVLTLIAMSLVVLLSWVLILGNILHS